MQRHGCSRAPPRRGSSSRSNDNDTAALPPSRRDLDHPPRRRPRAGVATSTSSCRRPAWTAPRTWNASRDERRHGSERSTRRRRAPPFLARAYEREGRRWHRRSAYQNKRRSAPSRPRPSPPTRCATAAAPAAPRSSRQFSSSWEHCRIPKLRRALAAHGAVRACWSDLDSSTVCRSRTISSHACRPRSPTFAAARPRTPHTPMRRQGARGAGPHHRRLVDARHRILESFDGDGPAADDCLDPRLKSMCASHPLSWLESIKI